MEDFRKFSINMTKSRLIIIFQLSIYFYIQVWMLCGNKKKSLLYKILFKYTFFGRKSPENWVLHQMVLLLHGLLIHSSSLIKNFPSLVRVQPRSRKHIIRSTYYCLSSLFLLFIILQKYAQSNMILQSHSSLFSLNYLS